MKLFPLPSNPAPEGAVIGAIETSDALTLRFARWPAVDDAVGTVCLLQGRADCIERYFETVRDLRRRGFAVATFDWRGQGGSEGRRGRRHKGHIDGFDAYDRDLDAFMEKVVRPDCPPPHFALAHSTGGLVCLRAEAAGRTAFERMVLTGPLLGLGHTRLSPATACRIAAAVAALGLGEIALPRRRFASLETAAVEDNPWTSDADRLERNRTIFREYPMLATGPPTFGWLHAACRAMAGAAEPGFAARIRTPALILAGSLDIVVSLAASERMAGALRAGSLIMVPGARHELLMERDGLREQVLAAVDAFLPGS